MEQVSRLITQRLVPSTATALRPKHKAIGTLFRFATRLEQDGQKEMVDAILHAARKTSVFVWWRLREHITAIFNEASPPSLDRVIVLVSPCAPWHYIGMQTRGAIARWVTAVSAVPYSEEVGQSVVGALLWVSSYYPLLVHIPANMWAWLKKRPSLPPVCYGRAFGSRPPVVRHFRGLGDIEILKSYLLLVWSEWDDFGFFDFTEMQTLIAEDFGGSGMWSHRDDLVKHLDHIQERLASELGYFEQYEPEIDGDDIRQRKEQYGELKNVLLEVDKRAMKTLIRTSPGLIFF